MMSGRSSTTGSSAGDDLHVVAKQVALGEAERRPEHLVQVADVEASTPSGQRQRAVSPCGLELRQLLDHSA